MELVAKFKDRLVEAMDYKGLRQVKISEETGISSSLLNKYVKGISKPESIKLGILAKSLGVSPVWLIGYDVSMNQKSESNLMKKIERLSPSQLDDVERFIDTFILKEK